MAISWFITAIVISEWLGRLYRRFDRDYPEGGFMERRWISWGTCRGLAPGYDARYFVLRLPIYRWDIDPCYDDDRLVCYQRAIRYFKLIDQRTMTPLWRAHWVYS
jgi:hypothetical protein